MPNECSILLLGLKEQALAADILHRIGYQALLTPELSGRGSDPGAAGLGAVLLQPSDDARAIEELNQVLTRHPGTPVVLVCSEPSVRIALDAWHAGAADVLFSPLTTESLNQGLQHALSRSRSTSVPRDNVEARFHYLDKTGKEHWIPIVEALFTIGRSTNNSLVLSDSAVSRSQAEVTAQGGEFLLRDLGSKHGTFVNGVRVEQACLRHGDRIRVGGPQGEALTFHRGDLLQSLLAGSGSKAEAGFAVHGFREMGMLLSTFHALSSIPLLDDLLNLVVDTAIEITGAERGFIMLKDNEGKLTSRCARNALRQSMDGSVFRTSRCVPEEVIQTGKRVVITDLNLVDESDIHTSTRRLGVRSISCVPLRCMPFRDSGGYSGIAMIETIGVLYVDSANIGGGMTQARIDALDTLASEAAMAIYNARLYKESREKQKLEEDLAIAREIQQALLPPADKALPFVAASSFNLPCREVGGDYFDYFELEGGRLGFALGDVAGKGMPAAILASMLQGIFCAQTLLDLPLPNMIANINCSLAKRGTGSRFVTFFFGILDPEGCCRYTNAGHNPPIIIRTDGSMQELTEGGMVLGLFPHAEYQSGTVRLGPGDHLVLFTDGVLEARNSAGEEFGDARIRRLLQENARSTAAGLLRNLKDQLAAFSANTPQHDDITMMVLGYREAD